MKRSSLETLTESNQHNLKDILNLQIDKFSFLSKRRRQLTIYAFIIGIVFSLSLNTKLPEFEILGFKFENFLFFQSVTPLVFSYLLLEYHLTLQHSSQIFLNIKFLTATVYTIPTLKSKTKGRQLEDNLELSEIVPFDVINIYTSKTFSLKRTSKKSFRDVLLFIVDATYVVFYATLVIGAILLPILFVMYSIYVAETQIQEPLYVKIPVMILSSGFLSFTIIDFVKDFINNFNEINSENKNKAD